MIQKPRPSAALFSGCRADPSGLCANSAASPPPPPLPPVVTGPRRRFRSGRSLTMAADLAFPPAGYIVDAGGPVRSWERSLPALQILKNAKIVVYGYTDDRPVGRSAEGQGYRRQSRPLPSKRSNEVVRYLLSKGVDPNIISAKGRGGTHPVASSDHGRGRAQNRRIEVLVETPSANTTAACRGRAGRDRRGSDWSRSARSGRGAPRAICARCRIPWRRRSRRRSGTSRRRRARSPRRPSSLAMLASAPHSLPASNSAAARRQIMSAASSSA